MHSLGDDNFLETVRKTKIRLLRMHYESGVGHIGGNLSSIDVLMFLHHKVLKTKDVFILSKGHAAGALYVTLWSTGCLSDQDLQTFHKDGTKLSGHPPPNWIPEIKFATGSLGHGLSLSMGVALGKKLKNQTGKVYCLLSDGELNEGSTWEALIFCVHHCLDNTVIIVDCNGLQGFGATKEVADLGSLVEKFRVFGFSTEEINGNECKEIERALQSNSSGPKVIIAHTKKGQGVSFMENKIEWHYLPLTEEQYIQALSELGGE